jgi:hypothetical protein
MMRKIATETDQRMKLNWLTNGDRPTSFFYNKVNATNPNNRNIYVLSPNGSWPSTSDKLVNEAVNYFTELVSLYQPTHQFPGIICKKILSQKERQSLCQPFQIEEVKTIVFQIDDNSSPRPDGLNSKFFKLHWEQLKNRYMECYEWHPPITYFGRRI